MNVSYPALLVMREFLVKPDPQCGAEVARTLKLGSWTVYPLIARLTKEGWIELVATLPSENQPDSHFYRITPAGRAALLDMLCRLTIADHLWKMSA